MVVLFDGVKIRIVLLIATKYKYFLFIMYLRFIYILLGMIKTKTIRIDDKLHESAVFYVKTLSIHGGFSGYVQNLIKSDFKKNGMKLPDGLK